MGALKLPAQSQRIQEAISKDCGLILEAIRRLIEGTCCLEGEEKICTWDLFHKTREALLEHVRFEERWVFPSLPPRERACHQEEHQRMLRSLELIRWDFEVGDGEMFRGRLKEFKELLDQHHAHGLACGCDIDRGVARNLDSDAAHIVERSQRPFLG